MGLFKDNVKGVVLALLSSAFIGGKLRHQEEGHQENCCLIWGQSWCWWYSYLLEPLWWVGMIKSKLQNPSISCAVYVARSLLDWLKNRGSSRFCYFTMDLLEMETVTMNLEKRIEGWNKRTRKIVGCVANARPTICRNFVCGLVSCVVVVGEESYFVAYAFVPAVLVTPLGALSIIISTVLAHSMHRECVPSLLFKKSEP